VSEQRDEWLGRLLEIGWLRASLFLWLAAIAGSPFFAAPRGYGHTLDWQFFQFFDEVARRTIVDFHQFPIWNPYFCGGTTLIGNPQTTFLVPTFPLVIAFGTTFGQRLSEVALLVIACEGGYRLMRQLGLAGAAALLGAVAFPFYGRTFGWLHDGQYGLQGTTLAPWIAWGWLRGLERPAWLALGGAFYAWQMCFRGIQPAPQLALALGAWALLEGRRRFLATRSPGAALWPLGAAAIVGLFGIGFAGLRMVPVLETVLSHPRLVQESVVRTVSQAFVEVYALPPGTAGYDDPGYAYVGVWTYLLFAGAVLFARARRRAATPLLLALLFMSISLGYHGNFSPYPWLHRAPLFRSLRNPTLYSFTGALFVVIAACYALDELAAWLRERPGRLARLLVLLGVPGVALGVSVELALMGRAMLRDGVFSHQPAARVPQEFHQARGNRFYQPGWIWLDRGSLSCYDETPWQTSGHLRPDLPAEEYLADPTAGTVTRLRWTPNRIDLEATLSRPSTVLINQNWAAGWRSSAGAIHERDGLPAIDLPAGTTRFAVTLWPAAATAGLLLTLLACGAATWLVRRDRRRAKQP
jgi:hypothetical protein